MVIAKTIAKPIHAKDKNLDMENKPKKAKPQKIRMEQSEIIELREFASSFLTKQAACDAMKIKRTITLDLLLIRGFASPDTVKNVRKAMKRRQAA